jgi:hypothetical protein
MEAATWGIPTHNVPPIATIAATQAFAFVGGFTAGATAFAEAGGMPFWPALFVDIGIRHGAAAE